jgi:polyphenol oxidase
MTLRPGGVSAPPFDTLNLGASVGDDPAAVAENRRRVAAAFGVPEARVMLMSQVHGVSCGCRASTRWAARATRW